MQHLVSSFYTKSIEERTYHATILLESHLDEHQCSTIPYGGKIRGRVNSSRITGIIMQNSAENIPVLHNTLFGNNG